MSDTGWVEVHLEGTPRELHELARAIRTWPGARGWWRSEEEVILSATGEPVQTIDIPNTRYYLKLTRAQEMGIDIGIAVLTDLLTTGMPIATAGLTVKALIVSLKTVSWEGKEVIRQITYQAPQERVGTYDWVSLERVRAAFVDATFDDEAALEELKAKGIVVADGTDHVRLVL